ncbi:flavin reductase family protein [Geodermatophilus sp. CPCC 205761]|uniref:2Fe-2S iron-sulfur cluster-binding protein n=1 Tax=Geodermatophilus sp. CPCC 205761 TaxID=2936597 RepID=UPI003EED944F
MAYELPGLLGTPLEDTLVYCCGPEPLLAAVEQHCAAWPAGSLRVERFAPKALEAPVRQTSFEVELAQTGTTVVVPPGTSVLQAVEDAGVAVMSSCAEGTCGTCETDVLAGEVDHRDSILTAEERAANDTMMICVSRAHCPRLVLDLGAAASTSGPLAPPARCAGPESTAPTAAGRPGRRALELRQLRTSQPRSRQAMRGLQDKSGQALVSFNWG